MALVEALGDRERHLRGEAEAAVRLALQGREVKERGRKRRRLAARLGDDAFLAAALLGDGRSLSLIPDAVRAKLCGRALGL